MLIDFLAFAIPVAFRWPNVKAVQVTRPREYGDNLAFVRVECYDGFQDFEAVTIFDVRDRDWWDLLYDLRSRVYLAQGVDDVEGKKEQEAHAESLWRRMAIPELHDSYA